MRQLMHSYKVGAFGELYLTTSSFNKKIVSARQAQRDYYRLYNKLQVHVC